MKSTGARSLNGLQRLDYTVGYQDSVPVVMHPIIVQLSVIRWWINLTLINGIDGIDMNLCDS